MRLCLLYWSCVVWKIRAQTRQLGEITSKGEFRKVGENLYRYSSNHRYYAVFRVNGKLFWKSLATADRELANRKLKDELEKQGKVDGDAANMSLSTLLDLMLRQGPRSEAARLAPDYG